MLGDVVHVRGQMRLQVRGRGDDVLRAAHPANAPAGHREGLGHPAEHHSGLGKLRDLREDRSEEHTSELQSRGHLVCRLLLEKKKIKKKKTTEKYIDRNG